MKRVRSSDLVSTSLQIRSRSSEAFIRSGPGPLELSLCAPPSFSQRATARAFCWSSGGCLGFLLSLLWGVGIIGCLQRTYE